MKAIYLDNHSTTQLDPAVLESMLPWFRLAANASSPHTAGLHARDAVEQARAQVADLLNVPPREILFTSGATESNNVALFGFFSALKGGNGKLITSEGEHSAVLDPAAELERRGVAVQRLPLTPSGTPEFSDFKNGLAGAPAGQTLISLMHANNETGAVLPLAEFAEYAESRGALFHSDATQSVGKLPLDLSQIPVGLVSFSAHKLHGPAGVGALVVRKRTPRTRLSPLVYGGGQELGLRSGTLNVAGIVGFGRAAELAKASLQTEPIRLSALRDELERRLLGGLPGAELNTGQAERLANSLNLFIPGVQGSALVSHVEGVCFSSGAACSSTNPEPSHVLRSMFQTLGQDAAEERARCSIRLAVSRFTSEEEVLQAATQIIKAALQLRSLVQSKTP